MNPMNAYTHRINTDPASAMWKRLAREFRKVDAIREFRSHTGCALKEAKEVVEDYLERMPACDGAHSPVVSNVRLGNGGVLTVTNNGVYATIQYTKMVAVNVDPSRVMQTVADLALEYSKDR